MAQFGFDILKLVSEHVGPSVDGWSTCPNIANFWLQMHFDGWIVDLCTLAQVSRVAYQAAIPWIYRHIKFYFSADREEQMGALLCLLKYKRPFLRGYVRRMDTVFDLGFSLSQPSWKIEYYTELTSLVPLLPRLTETS
jgi:hypothetical protein